jgi:non-specific serine/threonine protein kinase
MRGKARHDDNQTHWGVMEQAPKTIGEYRVLREIGRGATAVVYLAEHPKYSGPIALKYVEFGNASGDGAKLNRRIMKLLRAEDSVSKRLDHANIIHIYETVIEAAYAYIVMEYFPGTTLEKYCSFEHRLPVHRAIGIVFKCCMALDHAYRQGIVHRDIKPANILVNEKDDVRITDFGLALNVKKKMESDSTFIMGVGSPAYMSPEQIKGYPLNQKTDLYSLGVMMFHLLAGRLPFRATNPAQLAYKIINADPPPVSQLNPDVPPQVDSVIRKAMEKDLYSRYKNGAEFAKELAAVRFKILDDEDAPRDDERFSLLRKQMFFTEFDDVMVWEVLRISTWRSVGTRVKLMREGDSEQRFGILLEGKVELSVNERRVLELGPGTVFGELAWIDSFKHNQSMTVVSLEPLTYIEINPAALALASDEVQEAFQREVATVVAHRLGALAQAYSEHCPPATAAQRAAGGGLDLQLMDN